MIKNNRLLTTMVLMWFLAGSMALLLIWDLAKRDVQHSAIHAQKQSNNLSAPDCTKRTSRE